MRHSSSDNKLESIRQALGSYDSDVRVKASDAARQLGPGLFAVLTQTAKTAASNAKLRCKVIENACFVCGVLVFMFLPLTPLMSRLPVRQILFYTLALSVGVFKVSPWLWSRVTNNRNGLILRELAIVMKQHAADVEFLPVILAELDASTETKSETVRDAIRIALQSMPECEEHQITASRRKRLASMLSAPIGQIDENLAIAILDRFKRIAGSELLDVVTRLATKPIYTNIPAVQAAARECLPFVEKRAAAERHREGLLRASQEPEHVSRTQLLRGTQETPDASGVEMLRAVDE